MKLRFLPLITLATFAIAPFTQGCIISNCSTNGSSCTEFTTPTRFEGSAKSGSSPYTAGQGIKVVGVNGDIHVKVGSTSTVDVSFAPFILDKASNESAAKSQMDSNLVTDVSLQGNVVVVQTSRRSGSSTSLGADVTVTIPASFAGAFEIDQSNGEVTADLTGTAPTSTTALNPGAGGVTVNGAAGQLNVSADVGDVTVGVAAWGVAGQNGTIKAGNGTISLTAPAAADGQLVLTAQGVITAVGVPSTWAANETSGGKAYTMGAGQGAHVDVNNDFGDVNLTVK